MYGCYEWVWFSASRELQLFLQKDLDANGTLSAFAASRPGDSEHTLLICPLLFTKLWGGKAFLRAK